MISPADGGGGPGQEEGAVAGLAHIPGVGVGVGRLNPGDSGWEEIAWA